MTLTLPRTPCGQHGVYLLSTYQENCYKSSNLGYLFTVICTLSEVINSNEMEVVKGAKGFQ